MPWGQTQKHREHTLESEPKPTRPKQSTAGDNSSETYSQFFNNKISSSAINKRTHNQYPPVQVETSGERNPKDEGAYLRNVQKGKLCCFVVPWLNLGSDLFFKVSAALRFEPAHP
jgi:hypothetical protein